ADEIQPEHFAPRTISFVAVRHEEFPSLVELKDSSSLDKLTATILVSNLHKGMGGWFPKLRYFLAITRDIVEAERFGEIWQNFAARKKDFSRKVIHSLEGHWGREPLSAHNIYEDGIQQRLAERLRQMAKNTLPISAEVTTGPTLSSHLSTIADSYPLALALPDGHFVTCSAWSWSTYAFKGGRASPPPLSLQVERDWASREFLVEYFKAIGGTEEEVEEKIIELIEQGREWENLAPILLGTEKEATRIVPAKTIATAPQPPFARDLVRYKGNPILEPVKEHPWESRYVLNAGAVRLEGSVYLIYRAFGEDQISRLGLAISQDGFEFNQRIAEPIFEPVGKHDAEGCEDPRLTLIGNRLYMTYVVFDGTLAQIALASIEIRDFTAYRWGKWQRHGLVFPGCLDKDGALFPELFEGKYAMLHRVDPHIWITFSSHLHCPWSRKEHKILAGSTSGMMWDGHKIGAGSQPIKTKYGWLLITHGVDHNRVYRLGIMLLDLADPAKLVYRSPNSVLEPADELELGKEGKSWKSNVVFTCGAVTMEDGKELLEAGDQVIIYYGAADSSICAATAQVGHLVPKDYR
ncbi:MAG: glycosidase, partial [Chloroflexota bacterium]|nr:glycosidase [Chloroflexota bacterium]